MTDQYTVNLFTNDTLNSILYSEVVEKYNDCFLRSLLGDTETWEVILKVNPLKEIKAAAIKNALVTKNGTPYALVNFDRTQDYPAVIVGGNAGTFGFFVGKEHLVFGRVHE